MRAYRLIGVVNGQERVLAEVSDNRQRLVWHQVDAEVESIRLQPLSTWGAPVCRIFSMDVE